MRSIKTLENTMQKYLPKNIFIDYLAKSLNENELKSWLGVKFRKQNLSQSEYNVFLQQYYPNWKSDFGADKHKKLLEFYISYNALNPTSRDCILDAAGGFYSYIQRLSCQKKIVQDIRLDERTRARIGSGVEFLESSSDTIPLADKSVHCISCHHSFEHFQGTVDTDFIREIQRLLAHDGRCCIVPLFLANRFVEVVDTLHGGRKKSDARSWGLWDPTATIAGGESCGNYARIYDKDAYARRVLGAIDQKQFDVVVHEYTMGGFSIPDRELECHKIITGINYPYRALIIRRLP